MESSRNQNGIGEKELLVVSFGTSYYDSRHLTIGAVEEVLEREFPDYAVRRGFTSRRIIERLKNRDGLLIDDTEQALKRAEAAHSSDARTGIPETGQTGGSSQGSF